MDADARRRAVDQVAQIIYEAWPHQTIGRMKIKTWAEYENQDTYYRRMAEAVLDLYVADAVAQAVRERDEDGWHPLAGTEREPGWSWRDESAWQAEEIARLRAALEQIERGEESVEGLRPEFYGHAVKIAREALRAGGADVAVTLERLSGMGLKPRLVK